MARRPIDPDKCCPICGRWLRDGHRCDERTLAAIDGAHRRDPDDEDPPQQSIAGRLHRGLAEYDLESREFKAMWGSCRDE